MAEAGVETWAWIIAGVCSLLATAISFRLIMRHTRSFTKPIVQSKIIGIIWMVPIYATDSWISLRFPGIAIYLDMLRDCYEAYVLYLFFALMVAYIGEGDESKVVAVLETQPAIYHITPFDLCYREPIPMDASFLRYCKLGMMQYSVIKPLTTFIAIILELCGVYRAGSFDPRYGYVYICIIVNVSVCYAVYVLALFYIALAKPLHPYQAVPKFLCIKAVIFFSFWQGIVIAGLAKVEMIREIGEYTADDVATGVQNLLICFEMLLAAFGYIYAFSAEPFEGRGNSMKASLLEGHFAHDAVIKDFNEVMPVLLPSRFRPGQATSTTRLPAGRLEAELKKYPDEDEEDVESKQPGGTAAASAEAKTSGAKQTNSGARRKGSQRRQKRQNQRSKYATVAEQERLLSRRSSGDDHSADETHVMV